jgi:indolepyruvate ferredoxin oxidoreductase
MARQDVRLSDRLDLDRSPVLLNGTQALVRLMLMQAARDRAAGWRTAGYVSGYRGSPLGGLDRAMQGASAALEAADIHFQPGLNEDLAATAVWGTQAAALRGEGRVEGVFGLWYGKGPGVDRSGDALRHANLAGTAPRGGVVMVAGDDHTGESSTTCHQSDLAMIDAGIPVLYPAGVQEILDLGLYGVAMSRFTGLWAGMKAVKDTVESTAVVDGRPDRMRFVAPDVALPPDGLSIRLGDHWVAQEERLATWKWPAARAFARANGIDRRVHGRRGAGIGVIAAGKSWLDLHSALEILGITRSEAEKLGLTTYKLGQIWPIDDESLREWAEGLSCVVVVEEKRKLIEPQVAQALWGRDMALWGARGPDGALFPEHGALDPTLIARRLGALLLARGHGGEELAARLAALETPKDDAPALLERRPWFCAGCPHNTSTRVPEGARAGGGIGCHTMALWMDRANEGYTHMGAEGANWIGEAPFSTRRHVFQNLGDGTYNHSGLMAIRAAVAAGTPITYKILYNDAVAMTGGQANDGDLTPERICAELLAAGVARVAVVHDGAEGVAGRRFPDGVRLHQRDELDAVQKELSEISGVTALLYVQTCAAEKRRRRRTGAFAPIETRVFIDPDVCEGCGDCGVQSNCVALLPLETPLGRKRAVDQSACNADYSCLKGFCPSFVTVTGGAPRSPDTAELTVPPLPEPEKPGITGTWNVVVTGIGGTGAVTIGAVLAMAAHLEEKGAGMIEMAGLAQKGGAVHIHLRFANAPQDIAAIRVSAGQADALIGGDLVTSAAPGTRSLLRPGRARAVVNAHETPTGAFTQQPDFLFPAKGLTGQLEAALGAGRLTLLDASDLAARSLGDAIFANMLLTGAAWQKGLIPLEKSSIMEAIGLNGAAVEGNRRAFELGRWAAAAPDDLARRLAVQSADPEGESDDPVDFRARHLAAYQSERLAERYRAFVARVQDPDLRAAAARGYHLLLSYKDEYEVARLLSEAPAKASARFEGDLRLRFHLAPPLLSGKGPDGRPRKRSFGPWLLPVFKLLARLKFLRGTPADPFGWTAERRMERQLIRDYERDMDEALSRLSPDTREAIRELAELPLSIRGFGPVKAQAAEAAAARRDALMAAIRAPRGGDRVAAE